MPFRRAAEELRDVYANEIARVVSKGGSPAPELVQSWERYAAAATSDDPSTAFLAKDGTPRPREK